MGGGGNAVRPTRPVMANLSVNPGLSALEQLEARIAAELDARKPGPFQAGMKQAAARYLAFIRRRYVNAARGDGTWPDLAPSTKLARARRTKAGRGRLKARVNKLRRLRRDDGEVFGNQTRVLGRLYLRDILSGMRFEILRDTGLLLNSISTGAPGSIEVIPSPTRITVGTAIGYAQYHQYGNGVPKREIFVQPDDTTRAAMTSAIKAGAVAAIKEAFK